METRTQSQTKRVAEGEELGRTLVELAGSSEPATPAPVVVSVLLEALLDRAAPTKHVYVDTGDVREIVAAACTDEGAVVREIDGATINQPGARKVLQRFVANGNVEEWTQRVREHRPGIDRAELLDLLYSVAVARIANGIARRFGTGRRWETSVQLPMGALDDPARALSAGRRLRAMVPSAVVKVPFAPDRPHCLLVARDLEREGVPVNLTSTFSVRQCLVGALLADVTRTNVFVGRLNEGLRAERLGEHVALEAQRAIDKVRRETKTQLIVASMRDWRTFLRCAGCDCFTVPPKVLTDFLDSGTAVTEICTQLDTTYEDRLGIVGEMIERLGEPAIDRLWRVEPELVRFLRELRSAPDFPAIDDGEELRVRFEDAGFGDLFHQPTEAEREEIEASKLPSLESELTYEIQLDTSYSLRSNADFARTQAEMDRWIEAEMHP